VQLFCSCSSSWDCSLLPTLTAPVPRSSGCTLQAHTVHTGRLIPNRPVLQQTTSAWPGLACDLVCGLYIIMVGFHWSMIGQPGLARPALQSNHEPTAVPSLPVVQKQFQKIHKKKKACWARPERHFDNFFTLLSRFPSFPIGSNIT
jgi:hypothetical protein